jgi:hypothetical protein
VERYHTPQLVAIRRFGVVSCPCIFPVSPPPRFPVSVSSLARASSPFPRLPVSPFRCRLLPVHLPRFPASPFPRFGVVSCRGPSSISCPIGVTFLPRF